MQFFNKIVFASLAVYVLADQPFNLNARGGDIDTPDTIPRAIIGLENDSPAKFDLLERADPTETGQTAPPIDVGPTDSLIPVVDVPTDSISQSPDITGPNGIPPSFSPEDPSKPTPSPGGESTPIPDVESPGGESTPTPDVESPDGKSTPTPDVESPGGESTPTPDGKSPGGKSTPTPDGKSPGGKSTPIPDGKSPGGKSTPTPDGKSPDGKSTPIPNGKSSPTPNGKSTTTTPPSSQNGAVAVQVGAGLIVAAAAAILV